MSQPRIRTTPKPRSSELVQCPRCSLPAHWPHVHRTPYHANPGRFLPAEYLRHALLKASITGDYFPQLPDPPTYARKAQARREREALKAQARTAQTHSPAPIAATATSPDPTAPDPTAPRRPAESPRHAPGTAPPDSAPDPSPNRRQGTTEGQKRAS